MGVGPFFIVLRIGVICTLLSLLDIMVIVIKQLRAEKKLTQSELAKRAHISQPYLTCLERGVKKNPSLTVLNRLAQALGITSGALAEVLAGQLKTYARTASVSDERLP